MSEYTYRKYKEIGKGKQGLTFLVKDTNDKEYAMKTFKKTKSSEKIKKEYELQKIASEKGIAPKIYDIDLKDKYIIMERLNSHFYDKLLNGNILKITKKQWEPVCKSIASISKY